MKKFMEGIFWIFAQKPFKLKNFGTKSTISLASPYSEIFLRGCFDIFLKLLVF